MNQSASGSWGPTGGLISDRQVPSCGSLRPTNWPLSTKQDHYSDPADKDFDSSILPGGSQPQGTVRPGALDQAATLSGTLLPTTIKQTFEFSQLAGPNAMTIGHIQRHEPALYKPYVTTYAEELAAPAEKAAVLDALTTLHNTTDVSLKPWRKTVMPDYETRVKAH